MKKKVKYAFMICVLIILCLTGGCQKMQEEEQVKLDYTVTSEDRLPEELRILVDGKKREPFKLTYQDGDYLYICQGYGSQPTGGYSIQVENVSRTSNAVYFSATLIGPSAEDMKTEKETTPYIVIKTEYQDLTVVFD